MTKKHCHPTPSYSKICASMCKEAGIEYPEHLPAFVEQYAKLIDMQNNFGHTSSILQAKAELHKLYERMKGLRP